MNDNLNQIIKAILDSNLTSTVIYDTVSHSLHLNKAARLQFKCEPTVTEDEFLSDQHLIGLKEATLKSIRAVCAGSLTFSESFNDIQAFEVYAKALYLKPALFVEVSIITNQSKLKVDQLRQSAAIFAHLKSKEINFWSFDIKRNSGMIYNLSAKNSDPEPKGLNQLITHNGSDVDPSYLKKLYDEVAALQEGKKEFSSFVFSAYREQIAYPVSCMMAVATYQDGKPASIVGFTSLQLSEDPELSIFTPLSLKELLTSDSSGTLITRDMHSTLIIDDNEVNLYILKDIAMRSGLRVNQIATSALKVLESGEWRDHEFLIVDQAMPDMTGLEFIKAIKQRGSVCKILVVTASDLSEKECLDAGADGLIRKPVSDIDLKEKVQELFGS